MRWRDIFLGFGECIHTKGVVRQSGWVDTVFFRKDATHEVLRMFDDVVNGSATRREVLPFITTFLLLVRR